MRRWLFNLVVAWTCLSVGCTSLTSKRASGTASLLKGNPLQIRGRLLSQIPVGTPRADAMQIALSLGLEPTLNPLGEPPEDNSLHFQKEGKQWWGGQEISLIQIDCPDGVVEDISCEQIGVGW